MTLTLHMTVDSVIPSSEAISLLLVPRTSRLSTSHSRGLSSEWGMRENSVWDTGEGKNRPP